VPFHMLSLVAKSAKISPEFGTAFHFLRLIEASSVELAQLVFVLQRLLLSVLACQTLIWTSRSFPFAAQSVLQVFQAAPLRRLFLLRAPRWAPL